MRNEKYSFNAFAVKFIYFNVVYIQSRTIFLYTFLKYNNRNSRQPHVGRHIGRTSEK